MGLFDRSLAELQRRAALLPAEVQAWQDDAAHDVGGMGIHQSQFQALKLMMDELLSKQASQLTALAPGLPAAQFAPLHSALVKNVIGSHDLWRIFRYMLGQRQDERLRPWLKAADLIAADCYLTCMQQARGWGVVKEQEFREPPLVYLEAAMSPATASRGKPVGSLDFRATQYASLRLPIPVVTLPFDHAGCIWLFCTLHHEVGHDLDQDLALGAELKALLESALTDQHVPPVRRQTWAKWCGEVLADVIGVLLGGAGFAFELSSILLPMAPLSAMLQTAGAHPDHYVRSALLVQLLRACHVAELDAAADLIAQTWGQLNRPSAADAYVADCATVAAVCLVKPLQVLKGHALANLAPSLADDAKQAGRLADYLESGFGAPSPTAPRFPVRLVPVAAQLAYMRMQDPDQDQLEQLQTRTLDYLNRVPSPQFMAGIDRSANLRQLAAALDFGPLLAMPVEESP
jgi:hypothetical protein